MKGKVVDKGSGAVIPNVLVFLVGSDGEYVEGGEGIIGTETDTKGEYKIDVSPGLFLSFESPGYPRVVKSYSDLVKSGKVVMDDGSGSALSKKEVNAFVKDAKKITHGQWMIGIGMGLFLLLIGIIVAKKLGA